MTALADPVRRQIVERLSAGERTAGELGEGFGISQPAVSRHLRVLREAGLVIARADAQRRLYRLETGPLAEIDEWLGKYRRLWEGRLDRLAAFVGREVASVVGRRRLRRYVGPPVQHRRYVIERSY